MSDALDYAVAVRDDPAIKALPWREQMAAREGIWNDYVARDRTINTTYGREGTDRLKQRFLTSVPDEIKNSLPTPDQPDGTYSMNMLFQNPGLQTSETHLQNINSIRDREDIDSRNFGNARNPGVGAFRAFKGIDILAKAGNKLTEAVTGMAMDETYNPELEEYRDYVNAVYSHQDTGYEVGRGLGATAAIVSQMVGFHKVFGSVGAGGYLTKGLQNAVKTATANKGAVVRAITPWLAQAAVEVTGGVAYNIGHDLLDDKRGQDLRIVDQPGYELISELIFFGAGEALGGVISKSLGGAGRIFSPKRAINTLEKGKAGLTKVATEELADDFWKAITGETDGLGKEAIATLNTIGPEASRELNEALEAGRRFVGDMRNGRTKEGVQEYMFKTLYDMDIRVEGDDAIKVLKFGDNSVNKTFTMEELYPWMQKTVEKAKNINFDELASQYGRRFSMTSVGVRGRTGFKVSKMDFEDTVKTFVPVSGDVSDRAVKSFINNNLPKLADDIEVKYLDDYFKVDVTMKDNILYIPKKVGDALQSKTFADNLLKQVQSLNPNFKFSSGRFAKYIADVGNFAKYDYDFLKNIGDVTDLKLTKGGGVTFNFKGEALDFKSMEEAGATIHGSYFTDEELAGFMVKQHNMALVLKDGKYSVHENIGTAKTPKDGKEIASFENVEDFFMENPQLRPPRPIQMGPDMLIISPHGAKKGDMIVEGQREFYGSKSDAIKELKKYQDSGQYKEVKVLKSGNEIKMLNNEFTYKVEFADSGVKFETMDYDEATRFAGLDKDTFDGIEEIARTKGFGVEPTKVGLKATDLEGNVHTFRSNDELMTFLKQQDSLTNLSELSGQADEVVGKIIKDTVPEVERVQKGLLNALRKGISKVDKKFHGTALGTYKSKYLETPMGKLDRIADTEAHHLANRSKDLQTMWHKQVAEYDRTLYGMYGRYDAMDRNKLGLMMILKEQRGDVSYDQLAKEMNFKLTDEMHTTLDTTRKMFDALGKRYGVSSRMWLQSYFPHLRDIDPSKFMDMDVTSKKIITDAFGGGPQADYNPFFQNMRIDEMASASAFKNDILSVMKTYMQAGERQLMFGDLIRDTNDYIKQLGKDPGQFETKKILQQMRDQMSGRVYSSDKAADVADRIMKQRINADEALKNPKYKTEREAFNAADSLMRNNLEEFSNDLITSTLMAFKLRLPLRNMLQIYTTSGALTGNGAIVKAQDRVMKDFDAIYKKHMDRGNLMVRDPLDPTLNLMRRWVKGYNSMGMNIFRTSDDYTRMVTAEAWDVIFEDSLKLMKAGTIDYKGFGNLTWKKLLDPSDAKAFDDLMASGQTDLASAMLGQRMTKLTIFDYDSLAKPEGWKFGMGKLFGQYQTYPLQYMRMLKKIAAVSTPQELAVYSSRLMINTAGVGFFLHDVMGMEGSPMTPLGTIGMTGGPWVAAAARAYTGVTNYNADIGTKLKSVYRAGRVAMPWVGIPRKVYQSADAFAQGEAMLGLVHAMGGTPTDEKWTDPDMMMAAGMDLVYGVKLGQNNYGKYKD